MPEVTMPQLSVVLAATHDSAVLHEAVDRHQTALAQSRGELLIADGSTQGLPSDVAVAVRIPGADVFTLRAAAAAKATGQIIAITEDHCLPSGDWHTAIVRAHAEHPDAAAIGGAILNGSREKVIDRANFLVTFATFLPPLPLRHPTRVSPPVNLSFKRRYLDQFELTPGRLELEIAPRLYRENGMVLDDRILLEHVQSHGLRRTLASHFHNGRSTASLPRRCPPLRELVIRTAHNLVLPPILLAETIGAMRRKREFRSETLFVTPLLMLLVLAHSAGELVGTLRGPGSSPNYLE